MYHEHINRFIWDSEKVSVLLAQDLERQGVKIPPGVEAKLDLSSFRAVLEVHDKRGPNP
jgi:hypothetical protein